MSSDVFAIYQIDNSEKNREYRCRSYEYQIQHGFMITADNYGTGYSGTATRGMGAEAIRKKMESINPDKFKIIAVFRNKAYIHRSETSLSSQKGKQSEKHVGSHSEEHPVS